MDRDWGNILTDVGCTILSKLPEIVDHVCFGAVCKNWYCIAKDYNQLIRSSLGTLPMLLVPVSNCETQRRLYSVSAGKVLPNFVLSNIPNSRCCGFSYGWLAFVEEDLSVTLINPFRFRGSTIQLPILESRGVLRYAETVMKLIVTPNSTPDNYNVLAIYDGSAKLATIRSGDDNWIYIADDFVPRGISYCDIVFYKGLVYATDYSFRILSVNIDLRPPKVEVLKGPEPFNLYEKWVATYIVETTSGELTLLRRRGEEDHITKVFKVFKVEFQQDNDNLVTVVESNTLNGDAMFVGDNYSVSVKASNFAGCESNSIYFLDDIYIDNGRSNNELEDSGIYIVEDNIVARHYARDPNHRYRPPSIWVQPPYNLVSQ